MSDQPPGAPDVSRPADPTGGGAGPRGDGAATGSPADAVVERRRPGWRDFRRAYKGLIAGFWLALTALLIADGWLVYKRTAYAEEASRLRQSMSGVERQRADVVFAANKDKLQVMVELARRQAGGDRDLHLSVSVDSGTMFLQREGAVLRQMPVRVGPEQLVGVAPDTVRVAAPRGMRTVAALDAWSVTLDGGTAIYAKPGSDALDDSTGVTAGNVRARATDLQAILPNLKPGMSVYFY